MVSFKLVRNWTSGTSFDRLRMRISTFSHHSFLILSLSKDVLEGRHAVRERTRD